MSFLDKFKKSVGIEEIEEADEEKEEAEKEAMKDKSKKKNKKDEARTAQIDTEMKKPSVADRKNWFEQEGQLAVDVFQTEGEIYVQSAIAGVSVQDIDITIENDTIIIRGTREKPIDLAPKSEVKDYFYQECYWGPFSRQIILPAEVDSSKVEAVMKNGILTVKVPKILKEFKKKVSVKGA